MAITTLNGQTAFKFHQNRLCRIRMPPIKKRGLVELPRFRVCVLGKVRQGKDSWLSHYALNQLFVAVLTQSFCAKV